MVYNHIMNSSFKESFNYLVAFLAVLFGLSAFKQELTQINLQVFGKSMSIIEISIPFITLMIIATYFGALAMVSRNFTFKLFPLTKILERISYSLAFLGLIYPLLILTVFVISLLVSTIAQLDEQKVSIVTSIVATAVAVYTSYSFARTKYTERYEVKLEELRKIVVESDAVDRRKTSSYEIVMLFHQFTSLSKAILRLKGYGISNDDTYVIGRMLESIDVLDGDDLDTIRKLRNLRNKIVHEPLQARNSELKTARKELESLIEKLKTEILKLNRTDT